MKKFSRITKLAIARHILLSAIVLGLSSFAPANDPTLNDLWSGRARFEVEPTVFGADFGLHFLSVVKDQEKTYAYYNVSVGDQISVGLATTLDGVLFRNHDRVLIRSQSGWDSRFAAFPSAVKVGENWFLTYEGAGDSPGDIGLATSSNGIEFSKHPTPILVHAQRQPKDPTNLSLSWERNNIGTPSVYYQDGQFFVFYHGYGKSSKSPLGTDPDDDPDDCQVGLAAGADLTKLKRIGNCPVVRTSKTGWDSGTIGKRSILKQAGYYYMVFEGSTDQPYDKAKWSSGLARSKSISGPWEKFPHNPILPATDGGFGYDGPEFVQLEKTLYIYFRSPKGSTSRALLVLNQR